MSLNLFIFFVFTFSILTVLSFILEGSTGVAGTTLTAALDKTATTATVHSTQGFTSSGTLIINSETLCYTGTTPTTFTGLTRGRDCRLQSDPAAHKSGDTVYAEAAGLVNRLVGFNVAQAIASDGVGGTFQLIKHIPHMAQSVGKMIMWDYSYLEGPYTYLKLFILYPLSAGLILALIRLAAELLPFV